MRVWIPTVGSDPPPGESDDDALGRCPGRAVDSRGMSDRLEELVTRLA